MSTSRQNSMEGMIKEQATNFTNQAFDFLIQEVLRVNVWNGNLQNHLNRYGLDELLDELIEDHLDVDYRPELEDLIMIFILEDYSHRIHITNCIAIN